MVQAATCAPGERDHSPERIRTLDGAAGAAGALWEMVTVFPAIVSVPDRDEDVVLPATATLTEPLPVPDAPAVMVIQLAFDEAVHPHPLVVVTDAVTAPPVSLTFWDVGETVKAHAVPVCVTVTVVPATVSEPERVEPVLAATA